MNRTWGVREGHKGEKVPEKSSKADRALLRKREGSTRSRGEPEERKIVRPMRVRFPDIKQGEVKKKGQKKGKKGLLSCTRICHRKGETNKESQGKNEMNTATRSNRTQALLDL